MARSPSSGRGNLVNLKNDFIKKMSDTELRPYNFLKTPSFENPVLRGRTQLLQTFLAAPLRVNAHYGFGPRQPVANPRPVAEYQLQSVNADNLSDRAPTELPRILPQLLSELPLDLGGQAEVLPFRQ